jgi:hypothetical protein
MQRREKLSELIQALLAQGEAIPGLGNHYAISPPIRTHPDWVAFDGI